MSQNVDTLVTGLNSLASAIGTLVTAVDGLLANADPGDVAKIQAATATVNTTLSTVQAEIAKLQPPAPPAAS